MIVLSLLVGEPIENIGVSDWMNYRELRVNAKWKFKSLKCYRDRLKSETDLNALNSLSFVEIFDSV